MAFPVNMPQVGQDIEYARIVDWHVKEGEYIKEGHVLATVESDKASFEVEATGNGHVLKILYQSGEEAPVFQPIILIGEKDEEISNRLGKTDENHKVKVIAKEDVNVFSNIQHPDNPHTKVFISPSARRLVKENNLDFNSITGSGPNGRIVKKDILAILKTTSPDNKITPLAKKIAGNNDLDVNILVGSGYNNRVLKKDVEGIRGFTKSPILQKLEGDTIVPYTRTKKVISERLSLSKQTIPHFYVFIEVDMSETLQWRNSVVKLMGTKISINDIILKSTAETLGNFPLLNAHVDSEKVLLKKDINLGMAVSTEQGLLVPVISKANTLSLVELNAASVKITDQARKGIVNSNNPSSFTVSNLGMFGISYFIPVINPPECAILSVGAVEKKVGVKNDKINIYDSLTLGLACDHRAVDGAYASGFMSALKKHLENLGNS